MVNKPQSKPRRSWWKLTLAAVCVFLGCALLSSVATKIGQQIGAVPTQTPVGPSATTRPTRTHIPTWTPESDATQQPTQPVQPTQATIPTQAIPATNTPEPTQTPVPTEAPQPTQTLEPTWTPEPTWTLRPTALPPTAIPTFTPVPTLTQNLNLHTDGVAPLDKHNCPSDYPIKGNINSKGDRIYHIPGGRSYSRTDPERCFATEQDARNAGFVAAAD